MSYETITIDFEKFINELKAKNEQELKEKENEIFEEFEMTVENIKKNKNSMIFTEQTLARVFSTLIIVRNFMINNSYNVPKRNLHSMAKDGFDSRDV